MSPWGAVWRLLVGIAWAWLLTVAYENGESDQLRRDEARIASAEEAEREARDDESKALDAVLALKAHIDVIERETEPAERERVAGRLSVIYGTGPDADAGPTPPAAA